ncbi:hypothetical protein EVAR_74658_1 [Eumeta japonica]|uniref:Uncharacterized protein n=1 Tax=Eumeta variegata TaxID=151549 RepID=A0A4C1WAS1_EUMVA|nr:hypothetical protein EVAR_74658_1 [Eumeta japonica]
MQDEADKSADNSNEEDEARTTKNHCFCELAASRSCANGFNTGSARSGAGSVGPRPVSIPCSRSTTRRPDQLADGGKRPETSDDRRRGARRRSRADSLGAAAQGHRSEPRLTAAARRLRTPP